jgi:hypothetical protein
MRKKLSCLNQATNEGHQSRTMGFVPQHILCSASYRVIEARSFNIPVLYAEHPNLKN